MRTPWLLPALLLGGLTLVVGLSGYGPTARSTTSAEQPGPIFTRGQLAPAANFTGSAWVQGLISPADKYPCGAGSVQFAPGARTHWHTHPGGQILLVVEGTGRYQERGQPLRILRKGDVVKAAPGVEHWHGAAPVTAMTHVAINPALAAAPAVWGPAVTAAEYEGR